MTVLDTSAAVDYLLGAGAAADVEALFNRETALAAPDIFVFEVLAVVRRENLRGALTAVRAAGAIEDLGDLPIDLTPSLELSHRVWALRENFTTADAMFAALAEALDEPLATKDKALARATRAYTDAKVIQLG